MAGGESGVDSGPSAEAVDEDRERDAKSEGGEQADGEIGVGYRGHSGDRGEEDDEGGDEAATLNGGDGGEDEVEDVSAADELVAGDGRVGEEDGDDAEDTGGLVVAGFEQVGDGVLGEVARARRDEVDEREAGPSSSSLPECGESVLVGVLSASEEGAGADPRTEQREDQDEGGEGAACDEVVGLGLDLAETRERDGEERDDDDGENDSVEIHRVRSGSLVVSTTLYAGVRGWLVTLRLSFVRGFREDHWTHRGNRAQLFGGVDDKPEDDADCQQDGHRDERQVVVAGAAHDVAEADGGN